MLKPPLLAILLLGLPMPAYADITARYGQGSEEALIEVNGDGSARMGAAKGNSYSLFTSKGDYVVFRENGNWVAAPYEDFHVVLDELTAPMWEMTGGKPEPRPAPAGFALVEAGSESVAGFSGTRYELGEGEAENDTADKAYAVVSDAPELRPLGRPMARLLLQMPTMEKALTGQTPPALVALAEKLSSAALLRLGDEIAIQSVDQADIADDRFALPAKVLTRDEVKAMLDKSGDE